MIELVGRIRVPRLTGTIQITAAEGAGGPLQEKTIYPSHERKVYAPDEEFYGFSAVTAEPVPRQPFADVSIFAGSSPTPAQFVEDVNLGIEVVVLDEHVVTHCYYNGVKLPVIPEDVLAEYPYAWIRNNDRTGYYDLLLSSSLWYAQDSDTIFTDGYSSGGIQWYRVAKSDTEAAWVFNQAWTSSGGFGSESDRPIMWSNYDIPNGSADATEIYFEGTDPVPI